MNRTEILQALKVELTTDPKQIGYPAQHHAAAQKINTEPAVVDRESITSGMLFSSLVLAELATLNPLERGYLEFAIAAGDIQLTQTVRQQLGGMFPAQSQTRANLLALLKRDGTRAEELGLPRITESDVADALLRT